jgi:hypothetical protein
MRLYITFTSITFLLSFEVVLVEASQSAIIMAHLPHIRSISPARSTDGRWKNSCNT